jgi:uridine kinase
MKPLLIGIAGPSCSGKTTIIKEIVKNNSHIVRLKVDNYWKDKNTFPKVLGYRNWDRPENIKFDVLAKNLTDLKAGRKTEVPICKKGQFDRNELIKPTQIILVEGFLLFADKKTCDQLDLKIYIDIPKEVSIDRKIKRSHRDWPAEKYVKIATEYSHKVYWPEYKKYVRPFKQQADMILDGTADIQDNVIIIIKKMQELTA